MEKKINLQCDIYDACRTNTGRALKNDGHYDFSKLLLISRARFDDIVEDLQWCAENNETDMAISAIKNFATALLSAYEIQERTYNKV